MEITCSLGLWAIQRWKGRKAPSGERRNDKCDTETMLIMDITDNFGCCNHLFLITFSGSEHEEGIRYPPALIYNCHKFYNLNKCCVWTGRAFALSGCLSGHSAIYKSKADAAVSLFGHVIHWKSADCWRPDQGYPDGSAPPWALCSLVEVAQREDPQGAGR